MYLTPQIHTIPSLQEATQLPYPEICEALLSLTSERQAILSVTTTTTNQVETTPTVMPTPDDELLSAIQSTPFKVSTVFKVNEGFNKDTHNKHKSNRYVRTHKPLGHTLSGARTIGHLLPCTL